MNLSTGPNLLYFETGQGSEVSIGADCGVDEMTLEARTYGFGRFFRPFMVNNVSGFIGPETLYDGKEMIRASLEDHFMGKLMGLPMGMAPCYTNHTSITQDEQEMATMLLNAVTSFASNKFLVLLVMNVVLLIVGMFLEGGAALIVLAPLMVPIVKAAGIDLVHFGIVCNVNIMIGGLTPPFGSMMFTCVSITGCKMQEFIKECVPFIIALLIALLLLTYIPGISMLIPNLIY